MGNGSWLSRFRRQGPDVPFAPDRALYAIGDLHGRSDLLDLMLDRIEADASDLGLIAPVIVFLGDYVDRGPDSAGVLARVRDQTENDGETRIALIGNHEAMMLSFLDGPVEGRRWLRFGGLQTLASFGVTGLSETAGPSQLQDAAAALRAAMPAGLIDWLTACPSSWISGNIACVHAGAEPTEDLVDQNARTLIWGHRDFLRVPRKDGVWVVHGHTVVETAEASGSRIAVDTGAYYTDRLTACRILPDGRLVFLEVTG